MQLNNLPSLLFYLLGILILAITFKNAVKKQDHSAQESWEEQLEKEHSLQFVRPKPLEDSLFIHMDFKAFPAVTDPKCHDYYLALMRFATLPMVHLKDQSNFDLKAQYGPQAVELVSSYEQNLIECMQTALRYAEKLMEYDHLKEARLTLEHCVKNHCDLSKCYLLLAEVYKKQADETALLNLKSTAAKEMANSPFLNKLLDTINQDLKESV